MRKKTRRSLSMLKQFKLFAEYNQLMNQRIFRSAAQLSDDDLKKDCGAFFKSVFGSLNHIMVGDIVWLKRFATHSSSQAALSYVVNLEKPKSLDSFIHPNLSDLEKERIKIDEAMIQWIENLSEQNITECISYENMAGKPFQKQYSSLISHLFLHQIHHTGQITTLISQFGFDFGETDIIEIVSECSA